MYRLRIFLKPYGKKLDRGVWGRRLHGYILKAIQNTDPVLSQMIHDRKERQIFSAHLLIENDELHIQSPSKAFIQCMQQHFLVQKEIDLIDWKGVVQEVQLISYSDEDIMRRFATKFTLHFISPTTFYQSGNYYPLPDPTLLFLSALKITHTGNIDFPYSMIRTIKINYASFKTVVVDFEKFQAIGFLGKMTLNTNKLPFEDQKWLWKLACYGSIMGFGYKTAWGMGQAKLIPHNQSKLRTPYASEKSQEVVGNP
ncbi:hypothetical protein ADL26_20475 [Thermoactinomyces vulgaris]|jgi:CRISPR-associated endoribonuclease Cas6|nr:hypothetical protein ADL26_20475 [Thermoactinomyces vulgaris]